MHEVERRTLGSRPYAEDPEPRVPAADVAIYWINGLDPECLSEIVAKLRAQADRLEHEIRPQLIAARDDWAVHRPA